MGYRRRFTWEVAALCPHAIFYRYVNSVFMNACIQSLARVHLYLLQLYFTCIIITSEKRPLIQNAIFQKFFFVKGVFLFHICGHSNEKSSKSIIEKFGAMILYKIAKDQGQYRIFKGAFFHYL